MNCQQWLAKSRAFPNSFLGNVIVASMLELDVFPLLWIFLPNADNEPGHTTVTRSTRRSFNEWIQKKLLLLLLLLRDPGYFQAYPWWFTADFYLLGKAYRLFYSAKCWRPSEDQPMAMITSNSRDFWGLSGISISMTNQIFLGPWLEKCRFNYLWPEGNIGYIKVEGDQLRRAASGDGGLD